MIWTTSATLGDRNADAMPDKDDTPSFADHAAPDQPGRPLPDAQSVLRKLGLPPHTPPTLVLEAIETVAPMVGHGLQMQQQAVRKTGLFRWLGDHAGSTVDAMSIATILADCAVPEKAVASPADMAALAESR